MPLCKFCIHLNPVNADRCAKCGAWISPDPEPVAGQIASQATAPPATGEQPIDVTPMAVSPEPIDELTRLVQDLLQQGKQVEAIRVYRARTNASLKQAKDFIDKLGVGTVPTDDGLEAQLLRLLRANRKIEAIKRYRAQSGVGLKEAKDFVEALADRHGIKSQPAGCSTAAAILVACGSFAAWYLVHSL